MKPHNFYPGPSEVYSLVPTWINEAYQNGYMSFNHRSDQMIALISENKQLLHLVLGVPPDYHVFYISSATEAWEIVAQSFVKKKSSHIYNGAFGEKWYKYHEKLVPEAQNIPFKVADDPYLSIDKIDLDTEIICICQNETSNGTQLRRGFLERLKHNLPNTLIGVDVTSSFGGINLDFSLADIWFTSVQKCLGLPAGLGLMICSPRAITHGEGVPTKGRYNDLETLLANENKNQTTHTLNMLNIYLLNKVLKHIGSIDTVHHRTLSRARTWYNFFKENLMIKPSIESASIRSDTVIALEGDPLTVELLLKLASEKGLIIGKGYGSSTTSNIRIANFPAITDESIRALKSFFWEQLT